MSDAERDTIRDKAFGCLFGVFIGDALGLPVETMGPNEIKMSFGYVDTFIRNQNHKFSSIAKRSGGTISDDSQLSLAIMSSITREHGYSLLDIKKAHVEALDGKWGTPLGWGRTTREAVEKMKANEVFSVSPDGAGNGTCMKIAPLSIYSVYRTMNTQHGKFTNSFNASLLKKCKEISELTHGHPMCIVAAYCQARMIIRGMQDEMPKTSKMIANLFIDDAEYAETQLSPTWPDDKRLSIRLREILLGSYENVPTLSVNTPLISAFICTQQSSFVYNSFPLVAYCVSKYAPFRNFRYAVLETVNSGADADSNGSMVGAIIGAMLGFHEIPTEMVRGLKTHKELFLQARLFEQSI